MQKLLITGRPRCGKSSLIQESLAKYQYPLGGFAVQRLTKAGETWAFRLLDLAHEPYITHLESDKLYDDIAIYLAAPGKWQGVSSVFDGKGRVALESCLDPDSLVIMDELGIFERDALAFQASVFRVLNSKLTVLGVIKDKSSPFLDQVRQHPSVAVVNFSQADQAVDNLLSKAGR